MTSYYGLQMFFFLSFKFSNAYADHSNKQYNKNKILRINQKRYVNQWYQFRLDSRLSFVSDNNFV